jgi:hypothetical protein
MDKYWANCSPLSDEERMWNHARNQGISKHDVFKRAAEGWSLIPQKADEDLDAYLKTATRPALPA